MRSERRKVLLPQEREQKQILASTEPLRKGAKKEDLPEDKPLGDGIEVEVVLEKGPRSIRPRGSEGAAQMLKLVSRRSACSMRLGCTFMMNMI